MATKPEFVGVYILGTERLQLWADKTSMAAEYLIVPEDAKCSARLTIGTKYDWDNTLDSLYHETAELTLERLGCAYNRESRIATDANAYTFIMTHEDLAELTARLSTTHPAMIKDLRKVWLKHSKERRELKARAKKKGKQNACSKKRNGKQSGGGK